MASPTFYSFFVALVGMIAPLFFLLREPFTWRYEVLGFGRPLAEIKNIHGQGLIKIPDTIACEDIHYHAASGLIFGVAETDLQSRDKWFPPIANFKDTSNLNTGQIFTIEPSTAKKTRLELEDFSGPFITHGIDIYTPPSDPETVYIFAVNHLPNRAYSAGFNIPEACSKIELFKHTLGSTTATHLRSIIHPLIRTPNDIYASNEREIYVTNDHYHRGGLKRTLEDVGGHEIAAWSDIIYLHIDSLTTSSGWEGVTAHVALPDTHNPNGLGHGPNGQVLLGRAVGGVLGFMNVNEANKTLTLKEQVRLQTTVDNPVYFEDPYAEETGRDASGYVMACLTRALAFPDNERQPVSVWLLQRKGAGSVGGQEKGGAKGRERGGAKGVAKGGAKGKWEHRLIFQDDGGVMRTASTAVIVAIDPKENQGKKEAWLYVAGPMAEGMVRTKIEL